MFGKLCTYLVREKERESRVQWDRDDGEYWAGERVCARVQSNKGVGCDEPGRERMSWNEYAVMGWRERESFPLARNPICCVNCWCTCTLVFSDLLMTQVFGHQHFPIKHNLNNMQCFPHLSTLYCLCHAFVHSTICLETCFASFSWFTIPLALVSSANFEKLHFVPLSESLMHEAQALITAKPQELLLSSQEGPYAVCQLSFHYPHYYVLNNNILCGVY